MRSKILIITAIFVLTVGLFTAAGRPTQVIEWTLQGMSVPGDPAHIYLMDWVEDIYRMSGGRLRITVHPPDAIVPFMEVFKAVSMGVLDAGHTWYPFWVGIDPVFGLFCGSATGMTPHETGLWYLEWGGQELVAEKFAQYNIHSIPIGSTPGEVFLWAHHPIRTFADLKGVRVRAAGFSLEMFARLGVAAFWIPGGETAPALLKGVVDAAEFVTFSTDVALGFHEAARYAMVGPRGTTISDSLMINMDRWNELPPDLQAIVTIAAQKYKLRVTLFYERLEKAAVAKAIAHGVTIVHIDESLAKLVRQTFDELLDEHAARCPFFARVLESQRAFLAEYRALRDLIWPWE
ncbi:TRAP transporter substrate-binding protein DctP [Candidatus Acetothermia bacterium]|jgi:TRAP-type mannitol/chloroaromatic compound transport system substrate-binding protein|nr:TRAP transporter substrate-binding protein DctP [Candidatus Acetothermia bacterium]MCI2427443.1 TRAP transporter substrate-binding protein DctP [Candidatus Acetothermia bacterium]MCI2428514.1 TRAP transporter substrate-binding protein DctP [Candidatus Acetothermia bacterium]